jgi:DUF1365 family protein
MQSCIYEGRVSHSRLAPVRHRFDYRVFLMYLDLEEIDTVFVGRWFWSARRPALARFRRDAYFGPPERPLDECLRDLVATHTGRRPRGPIRLLTNLRYFGYCFNPVSYYFCFDEDDAIAAIVAEVTNTPWGERTTYVLPISAGHAQMQTLRFRTPKAMHVSPFMPMDLEYDWLFTHPGQRLAIRVANLREGKSVFDASIVLDRVEISGRSLARVLLRFPAMTATIVAAIHWQALRLWLKGCPVYAHPHKPRKCVVPSRY